MRLIRGVLVLRVGRWGIAVRVLVGGVLLLGLVVGVGVVGVLGVRRGGVVVVEGGDVEGEEGGVEVVVVVVGAVVEGEDVESHFVSILDVK